MKITFVSYHLSVQTLVRVLQLLHPKLKTAQILTLYMMIKLLFAKLLAKIEIHPDLIVANGNAAASANPVTSRMRQAETAFYQRIAQ